MENTKTKMTEQEKQELMDALDLSMEKERDEFSKMHTAFLEQHDFMEQPNRQTKSITAWTRENILLSTWNQFIQCESKMAEFAGWEEKGKGFRTFNERRRCDVALDFAHYFLSAMEHQVKAIEQDIKDGLY